MSCSPERDALVKLLIERFRHRPKCLTPQQTVAVIRRLIKHARWMSNGCIAFTGALNNGHYAKMNVHLHGQHHQLYCHKLSWGLSTGKWDLPEWKEIAHSCDTPPCFHPDHVAPERRYKNRQRSAERTQMKLRGQIPRAPRDYRAAA